MNKKILSGAIAAILAAPAMAQTTSLDQLSQQVQQLKEQNERLGAEVDYLKEQTKASRKDSANTAVDISNLKTTTSKYTWSGDFRYRNERITTAQNLTSDENTRNRDRIRVRFGVAAKVNDTINFKLQLATTGAAPNKTDSNYAYNGESRSTNQTLDDSWSRKPIGIDQAYVDWKAFSFLNLQLGKMPMPWVRTGSYFWDGDLTPEGASLKFSQGVWFGSVSHFWLEERNNSAASGESTDGDPRLVAAQVGLKQPIGKTTLTAAIGYFDLVSVKGNLNTNFYEGAFGNTLLGSGATATYASDYNIANALVQLDFPAGKFPMTVFVDYMKNTKAEVNPVANKKLNTAYSAGITFNKASAAKSWEVGYVYQQSDADAVFGKFHDSDFGAGNTDTNGHVIKAAWVPATNWTINGTYFINKLNNDTGTAGTNKDLKYKRLQLDLNYKY